MAADSADGLPTRCLQKILAEKDAKNKQHARLKAACEAALGTRPDRWLPC
jgi:hypothetical protein